MLSYYECCIALDRSGWVSCCRTQQLDTFGKRLICEHTGIVCSYTLQLNFGDRYNPKFVCARLSEAGNSAVLAEWKTAEGMFRGLNQAVEKAFSAQVGRQVKVRVQQERRMRRTLSRQELRV